MSTLKHRLDSLRRQTGTAAPQAAAAEVRARLERLGGRAAGGSGKAAGRETPAALARRLGGELVDEHLILVDRRLPLHTTHGRWSLGFGRESAAPLAELPARVGYVDTETTGLAGGTGTLAFMVGLAELEEEAVRVRQWLITAFAGEAAMLVEVRRALAGLAVIVSYNGKSFDLPLLRDRQRLHRAALPEPDHLDLLHPARRLFVRRWPDCRLATVERRLLGLTRQDDLPGAEAPQAWREFLLGYRGHALHRVLEHNRLDLLSLLVLPPALARVMRDPLAFDADPLGVAAAWSKLGDAGAGLETLLRCRDRLDHPGQLQLALALKRAGRWTEAVSLWEPLVGRGCQASVEELAKYHEHVRRDWRRALDYASRLAESPAARQRRERLRRRLEGSAEPSVGVE